MRKRLKRWPWIKLKNSVGGEKLFSTLVNGWNGLRETSLKFCIIEGFMKKMIECLQCGKEIEEGEALNGYCPKCTDRYIALEKVEEAKKRRKSHKHSRRS